MRSAAVARHSRLEMKLLLHGALALQHQRRNTLQLPRQEHFACVGGERGLLHTTASAVHLSWRQEDAQQDVAKAKSTMRAALEVTTTNMQLRLRQGTLVATSSFAPWICA